MIILDDSVERAQARNAINELIAHHNWLGEPISSFGLRILVRAYEHLADSSVARFYLEKKY